tara:strand:- start:1659 stop:2000 length:342 start_codon:yes stop_codon:yes gene_type:complete
MKKNCIICNEEFIPHHHNVKYCSDLCREEYRKSDRQRLVYNKYHRDYHKQNYNGLSDAAKIKQSKYDKKQWLEKNNITQISEKGRKNNETRAENNKNRNSSIEDIIAEYGDIE